MQGAIYVDTAVSNQHTRLKYWIYILAKKLEGGWISPDIIILFSTIIAPLLSCIGQKFTRTCITWWHEVGVQQGGIRVLAGGEWEVSCIYGVETWKEADVFSGIVVGNNIFPNLSSSWKSPCWDMLSPCSARKRNSSSNMQHISSSPCTPFLRFLWCLSAQAQALSSIRLIDRSI